MAVTISPADGFISRLIQQTQQASSAKQSAMPPPTANQNASRDQSSISPEARQAMQGANQQDLESRLLDLYNQKGGRKS